ncbi:hypothetical protein N7533_013347 [Penicillium manginii]|uniref:uncharacterized protein n=1 Tax=Penicillium manginii TaxID=203109 RepID=UPI002546C4E6|nr:uncharacterized protein N7533_013347 [Penicillium manginii]KAJ5732900.1 hypothetical protein N7533_013347 [Penicillium manginii]
MSCLSLGRLNRDYHMARYGVQLHRATIQHISKLMIQDPYNEDYIRAMVILKILEIYAITAVDFTREEFEYLIESKTGHPIDGLFEIFVELGCLVTDVEQTDHSDQNRCQELLQRCRTLKEKAVDWYGASLTRIGGVPFVDQESHQSFLPPTDDLFGAAYSFVSLDNARIHMFYWMALAINHSLIYQAEVLVLSHTRKAFSVDPTTHGDFVSAGFYADQFCRSIPYFLQGHVELWGMVAVLVSMPHMLKIYIHLRSRDNFFWCLQFCSFMSMFGIEMATYISEAWRKTWYLAEDPSSIIEIWTVERNTGIDGNSAWESVGDSRG